MQRRDENNLLLGGMAYTTALSWGNHDSRPHIHGYPARFSAAQRHGTGCEAKRRGVNHATQYFRCTTVNSYEI